MAKKSGTHETHTIDAQGRFRERILYPRLFQTDQWRVSKHPTPMVEFSASSEEPLERWWGMEILSHDPDAVNLSRAKRGAMPLLFNHDIDTPIGMVRDAHLGSDKRLWVEADFFETPRASEIRSMIEGGLHNVSIAYRIGEIVENKKDETFTVTKWEPFEVSIVSVPADASVGIGRSCQEYEVRMIRTDSPAPRAITNTEETMDKDEKGNGSAAAVQEQAQHRHIESVKDDNRPMPSPPEIESARRRAIENFAKANNITEPVWREWVVRGYSLEQVSNDLLKIIKERAEMNPQSVTKLGLSEGETQRYSLLRAIKACADKEWTNAPFEADCSRTIAQKLGKVVDPLKFYVPLEVLRRQHDPGVAEAMRRHLGLSQRDLTVATAGAGGFLVETSNVGFIEMLYNRSVAMRMGATRLTGLQGNVSIPRQSAAATGYWLLTEATAITESQQTFVQVALTPKTVGGYTEISRLLLLQSNPGAEGIVTQDLARVIAVAVDLGVINGSGAAGQPTGIIGTVGIGGVTGTTIAYAGILEFQTDVAAANVVPVRGGYVTTPAVAALLMARARFANTDTPLWAGNIWDGMVSGFPAMSSMQVPTANILFGDWAEVVVAEWGTLEVEVNPYANFQAGIIGVRCMYTVDVGVRRPFAFSLATTVT